MVYINFCKHVYFFALIRVLIILHIILSFSNILLDKEKQLVHKLGRWKLKHNLVVY